MRWARNLAMDPAGQRGTRQGAGGPGRARGGAEGRRGAWGTEICPRRPGALRDAKLISLIWVICHKYSKSEYL